jgi:hypothetical protein
MSDCCLFMRGEIFAGPPINASGVGVDSFGWGDSWGLSWGGYEPAANVKRPQMPQPMRPIGNAQIEWTPNYTTVNGAPNYQGFGSTCSTDILDSVDVKLTIHCMHKENLALVLNSSLASTTSTSIVGEFLNLNESPTEGYLIPFAVWPINQSEPLEIRVKSGSVIAKILAEGVDYVRNNRGVVALTNWAITVDQTVEVDYTSLPAEIYEGIQSCPWYSSLQIVGTNLMKKDGCNESTVNAGLVAVDFYRAKLISSGTVDLFAENSTLSMELTGELLPVKVDGQDRYLRWTQT